MPESSNGSAEGSGVTLEGDDGALQRSKEIPYPVSLLFLSRGLRGPESFSREKLMSVHGARQRIEAEVLTWPGVVSQPHRFGGTEFMLGKREVGHVHGDRLLDVAFPKPVRNEVVTAGLAEPHHILPDSGWVSFYIKKEEDVEAAVALLRRSYDLAREQQARKYGTAAPSPVQ
jgi:hypothetical protein